MVLIGSTPCASISRPSQRRWRSASIESTSRLSRRWPKFITALRGRHGMGERRCAGRPSRCGSCRPSGLRCGRTGGAPGRRPSRWSGRSPTTGRRSARPGWPPYRPSRPRRSARGRPSRDAWRRACRCGARARRRGESWRSAVAVECVDFSGAVARSAAGAADRGVEAPRVGACGSGGGGGGGPREHGRGRRALALLSGAGRPMRPFSTMYSVSVVCFVRRAMVNPHPSRVERSRVTGRSLAAEMSRACLRRPPPC